MKIKVKVIPNASRNEIVGWQGDILKVKVKASPDKGKANKELINVLTEEYKTNKGNIEILYGKTSRKKLVEIR